MSDTDKDVPVETHRTLAKKTNGEVWALLERSDRSPEDDERMVNSAHASLYHWLLAGTAVHAQRGEWLLSRVYTVLGRTEPALHHAERRKTLTFEPAAAMEDFDLAFAEEALARASALAGDTQRARAAWQAARDAGTRIADPEDREIFQADFEGGPWFGLEGAGPPA